MLTVTCSMWVYKDFNVNVTALQIAIHELYFVWLTFEVFLSPVCVKL